MLLEWRGFQLAQTIKINLQADFLLNFKVHDVLTQKDMNMNDSKKIVVF